MNKDKSKKPLQRQINNTQKSSFGYSKQKNGGYSNSLKQNHRKGQR